MILFLVNVVQACAYHIAIFLLVLGVDFAIVPQDEDLGPHLGFILLFSY